MFQLFYLLKGQSCPWASCHMGKFKDLKLQPTVCLDFFPSSVLPFIFLLSFHLLIVVCNTVYIKKLDCLAELMKDAPIAIPYPGAKERYILDIENHQLTKEIISILEPITPLPKPKKKK